MMRNPTVTAALFLLGVWLAPSVAAQRPKATELQIPSAAQRSHDAAAERQANRWTTFLELDARRVEAVNRLLQLGPAAVPALLRALSHPSPIVAQRAAHILRALGSQAAAARQALVALSEADNVQLAALARYALSGIQPAGFTLVCDYIKNQVIERDVTGKVVRTLTGVKGPWDVERLSNGNYLICGLVAERVVEMTADGEVVWSFAKIGAPRTAQRLPSGNTLIVDSSKEVLEVDRAGKIVWRYDGGGLEPLDAERLVNGNTLISDMRSGRVIEVDPDGAIVWESVHKGRQAHDVDRLPNGNTLITFWQPGRVIEITPEHEIVFELKDLQNPLDADRLPNGNVLVAEQHAVSEFDAAGKKLWSKSATYAAEVQRY